MSKVVIIPLHEAYQTLQTMVKVKDHSLYETFLMTIVYEVLYDSFVEEEEIDSLMMQLGVDEEYFVDIHSIIYNIVYHILIPYRELLPVNQIEQVDFEHGNSYRLIFTTL